MTTFIYALTEPFNENEIRYIGKSDKPYKRHTEHILESVRGTKTKKCNWIRSLIKKDLVPELIILDEVLLEEWSFWEQFYYDLYKSWGFKLLNMCECGYGATKHHPETMERLRQISLSKSKRGEEHHMFGKTLSQEQKDKMKQGRQTKPRKTVRIYQYTKEGELVNIFESIKDCMKKLSLTRNQIQECIAGYKIISKDKRKNIYTVKGFIFRKEGQEL